MPQLRYMFQLHMNHSRINSFSGIKFLAVFFVFLWHGSLKPLVFPFAAGSRSCEILFILSGFLVAYHAPLSDDVPTIHDCVQFWRKKFISVWFIHILCSGIMFLRQLILYGADLSDLIYLPINLSLLQAWFTNPEICKSYSGESWFLSALLFCYFITPVLLHCVKRLRFPIVILIGIFCLHSVTELLEVFFPGQYFSVSTHTYPLIRCLEYSAGMITCRLFRQTKERFSGGSFLTMSCLEVFALGLFLIVVANWSYMLTKGFFLLLECLIAFVFAFDAGFLSKILGSKPARLAGCIQLEFYLFHQIMNYLVNLNLLEIVANDYLRTGIVFCCTITVSVLFNRYLRKPAEKGADRVLTGIECFIWKNCSFGS